MKDSGIKWIGEIPDTWEIRRFKDFGQCWNGLTYSPSNLCDEDSGTLVLRSSNIQDSKLVFDDNVYVNGDIPQKAFVNKDDILICSRNGSAKLIGKNAIIPANLKAAFGAFMMIYRCKYPRYLSYILNSPVFESNLSSFLTTTVNQLTADVFLNIKFPFVSDENQQQKIVNFLDSKCSELQSAIDNTKQTIEEYKKLKQTVITKVVTKGLEPNRIMKDSGIEWIGEIPEEWETANPKSLFSLRKQKATKGERQLSASQKHGIVYQDEYMEMTGARVVTVMKDFDILKHVEAGDFVIHMRSFQGGIEYSEKSGSISSAYVMLIPNLEYVYPRYYKWLLKSENYIRALNGTTDLVRDGQAMRYSNFAQVRLIRVPIAEQKSIAEYLDCKCSQIDTLICQKEQFITELEKYKQSLIYEYVTGKKQL